MSMHAEIDDLRYRHHALEGEIEVETTQISPDELKISALKKEKLKIKDLIHQLEATD